jgi:nucleotide-binding universal stress UspA family protein
MRSQRGQWLPSLLVGPVEIRVEHGPVVEAVLGGAIRARMVVAGSRGRGALTGAVLGSTSPRTIVVMSQPCCSSS